LPALSISLGICDVSMSQIVSERAASDNCLAVSVVAVFCALLFVGVATAQVPSEGPTCGDPQTGERNSFEEAIRPLTKVIADSKSSRVTIESTVRTMLSGQVTGSEKQVYQIASLAPNKYRIQYKTASEAFQLVSDGSQLFGILGEVGFFRALPPKSLQEVVASLALPVGPYPEPIMALSLAGVDPSQTLMSDMSSLKIVNRDTYEGTPAVLLRGVQADGVGWALWVATESGNVRPLRMKVDLTPVLRVSNQLPEAFSYEVDFKFTSWKMGVDLAPEFFSHRPSPKDRQFESLDAYYRFVTQANSPHRLLGKTAPSFAAQSIDGKLLKIEDLKGKVVVLDFCASWCSPCLELMPIVSQVSTSLAGKGVVAYAVNVGEDRDTASNFFKKIGLTLPLLVDADGSIAESFGAIAIPQTVLIDRDGRIQAIHVGVDRPEAFREKLRKQLNALVNGENLVGEAEESGSNEK